MADEIDHQEEDGKLNFFKKLSRPVNKERCKIPSCHKHGTNSGCMKRIGKTTGLLIFYVPFTNCKLAKKETT